MSTMLYKTPGPHRLHDVDCEYVIVGDADVASYLSSGWYSTPTEAGMAGSQAPFSRADLEAKARERKLKFDGRTSDRKLQSMLENA